MAPLAVIECCGGAGGTMGAVTACAPSRIERYFMAGNRLDVL